MGQKHPYPKYLPNNILYIIIILRYLSISSLKKSDLCNKV